LRRDPGHHARTHGAAGSDPRRGHSRAALKAAADAGTTYGSKILIGSTSTIPKRAEELGSTALAWVLKNVTMIGSAPKAVTLKVVHLIGLPIIGKCGARCASRVQGCFRSAQALGLSDNKYVRAVVDPSVLAAEGLLHFP